ncbi:MAG TPA: TIGR02391 family protein [Sphingomonas sp.]|jgi:uncharacterized protein (TIGR02391 family)|uniref:TIGR02391 family protein n=1 Tax=Sphingomonas sp. TaxID=28214 RepID=UPI002ED8E705
MPNLTEIFPDAAVLVAMEPDELGLRMLPCLASWPNWQGSLDLRSYVDMYVRPNLPGQGEFLGQAYPAQHRAEVGQALREAWAWLVGSALLLPSPSQPGSFVLSRRADKIADAADPVRAHAPHLLHKGILDEAIREDVWALFQRGKFDTAVFEAMKAVEVAVRSAANLSNELVGVKLMRTAFHPEAGALTDASLDSGERHARADLFAGTIGSYKNPQSHRHVALSDSEEAAELILLANHLLRIVRSRALALMAG